ncbi:MAG TPA: Gfo/Idh/MocA family oxidoreductase [Vicinamibacteria bacterium]
MTAARRLNLVFLGCGAMSAAHSRTLRALSPEVRCFFASRPAEKAMAFEKRFHGAGSFGSYGAALADGRMDVAFVATPPDLHLGLALEALDRGKDVIVEKPAFTRPADFDLVARAQVLSGRRVLVAENYCYKPLARTLRRLLKAGVVGRPLFVQLNALKEQEAGGWRAETTGGALFEGGIHWIDLLAHLGPAVRAVRGFRPGPQEGPPRSALVVVEYADGSVGTLQHSWEARSRLRGLQLSCIRGTEGSIVFESNGLFVLVDGRVRRLIFPGLLDLAGYRAMFRDFLRALQGGPEPLMTLERARRDVEIVLSAQGGAHGFVDRGARGRAGRSAHFDVGNVQGLPA